MAVAKGKRETCFCAYRNSVCAASLSAGAGTRVYFLLTITPGSYATPNLNVITYKLNLIILHTSCGYHNHCCNIVFYRLLLAGAFYKSHYYMYEAFCTNDALVWS